MDGNQRVAQFVRNLCWEALPAEVQRKVKLCLLDVLGATLSGTIIPISQITADYAAQAFKGAAFPVCLVLSNIRSGSPISERPT